MSLSCLIREDHSAESAVEELVLIELARGIGRARNCQVSAQNRVARHAVGRGTKGSGTLAVVDISKHLRYLLVPATHTVCHLHLGHVEILGAGT